ncbi:MAG: mechanosensitive ion channel family protein [Bryobacterales bacterium]|nr:mechanosensitive ion channel family protein [Bryobacterales bacterium]
MPTNFSLRWDEILQGDLVAKVAGSLAFLAIMLLMRAVVAKAVLPHTTRAETRRRALVNLRNFTALLVIMGLGAIWADAVRTFAVSVLALGVAAVIATKELIQCFTGSIVRTTTNAFSVGDRIEITGFRGDVIDINFVNTTLLEVGPGPTQHLRTGRLIRFPNSKLLDSVLVNESYMERFLIHVFRVPWKLNADWEQAEALLLEAATAECAPYLEEASDHMERLEHTYGLVGLRVRPRVWMQLMSEEKIEFLVRLPVPLGQQSRIEEAIVRRFLSQYPGANKQT